MTVIVLLSSEVIWQRVPDSRTHHSEDSTADCSEPRTYLYYGKTVLSNTN